MSLITKQRTCKKTIIRARKKDGKGEEVEVKCSGKVERRIALTDGWFVEDCDRCDYLRTGFIGGDAVKKLRKEMQS